MSAVQAERRCNCPDDDLEMREIPAVVLSSPAITGFGLVTPLAQTVAGTWDALLHGRFITDHSKISLPDAQPAPRVIQLACNAAAEAVRDAGWSAGQLASSSTALVVGTSKGPIESWLEPAHEEAPSVHASLPLGLYEVAAALGSSLQMGAGPRLTLSAACASGLHALIRAALMLQHGACNRAIVVAAEASVHPLFLGSFKRLGVFPPEGFGCRPFDRQRAGFLMSDAAAAVCLEANGNKDGGSSPRAVVERFAMGNDATHLTASDPEGTVLRRLLKDVTGGRLVDLVHAHGTATSINDAMELNAIESAVAGQPALYSHKAAIGHTLGAAGLISIVLNCLAMRNDIVPGNVRLTDPLPTRRVRLSSAPLQRPIRRSLAIAAGFGGPTAVVSLVKP